MVNVSLSNNEFIRIRGNPADVIIGKNAKGEFMVISAVNMLRSYMAVINNDGVIRLVDSKERARWGDDIQE